jgi:hypothetical protein
MNCCGGPGRSQPSYGGFALTRHPAWSGGLKRTRLTLVRFFPRPIFGTGTKTRGERP